MRVLVLDQFSTPSPYQLQHHPRRFSDLVAEKLAEPRQFNPARVEDVDPVTFKPEMCTTVIREGADGVAEIWMTRWDSSG